MLFCGIPGPLSSVCNSIMSFLVSTFEIFTIISGKIRASSQASNELSTASLTAVMIERGRESNPRKCLFFSKNSEIAICFWLLAILFAMPAMRITPPMVLLRPNDVGP